MLLRRSRRRRNGSRRGRLPRLALALQLVLCSGEQPNEDRRKQQEHQCEHEQHFREGRKWLLRQARDMVGERLLVLRPILIRLSVWVLQKRRSLWL